MMVESSTAPSKAGNSRACPPEIVHRQEIIHVDGAVAAGGCDIGWTSSTAGWTRAPRVDDRQQIIDIDDPVAARGCDIGQAQRPIALVRQTVAVDIIGRG